MKNKNTNQGTKRPSNSFSSAAVAKLYASLLQMNVCFLTYSKKLVLIKQDIYCIQIRLEV
jgi:hypothetical protein